MAKKISKVSKSAIAAALAASAVVPAASAFAAETTTISNVVVTQDGKTFEITKAQFDAAIGLEYKYEVASIKVADKYYSKYDFNLVIGTGKTAPEAIAALATTPGVTAQNITPVQGTVGAGGVISAETPAADTEKPVITVDTAAITVENGAEVTLPTATVTDNKDTNLTATQEIKDAAGKSVTAIDTKVAGTYTVTYTAKDAAGNEAEAKTVTVTVKAGTLAVASVSAINSTSLKVTFNSDVKEAKPVNFVVKNSAGEQVYTKSATVSTTNKKEVTVELYDTLKDESTYTVTASGVVGTDNTTLASVDKTVTYTKAVAASIAFKSTKLPQENNINLKDYVVVKDAAGNDITSDATVEFVSSLPITDGKVNLANATSFILGATVKDTKVTTGNIPLSVEAAKAVSLEDVKLKAGTTDVATVYKGSYLDKDGKALLNPSFVASFKDQYGRAIAPSGTTYASLNPELLVVNSDGTVTARVATGTAYVRATNGTLSKTIAVEIKADPKVASITPAETAINLVATGANKTVKLVVKDQYNNVLSGQLVTATVDETDGKDYLDATISGNTDAKGESILTIDPKVKGTEEIKLSIGTGVDKVETTVTVTITEAGAFTGYAIVNGSSDNQLDIKSGSNDTSLQLNVYAVDASSNATSTTAETATWTTSDASVATVVGGKVTGLKVGTATITAKVGTITVGTFEVKVVDTTSSIATVTKAASLVKVDAGTKLSTTNVIDKSKTLYTAFTTKDKDGTEITETSKTTQLDSAIDKIYSSNSNIISVDTNNNSLTAKDFGTATITTTFKDTKISPVVTELSVDYLTPVGGTYTKSFVADGTFGPATGTWTVNGKLDITGTSTTAQTINLQNLFVTGDLTVDAPKGTVDIGSTVKVSGKTTVKNVSTNTLIIRGLLDGGVEITDTDGGSIQVISGAQIGAEGLKITSAITGGQPVIFKGDITVPVVVEVANANVQVQGTLSTLKVAATGATVNLTSSASVANLAVTSAATSDGKKVNVTGDASKISAVTAATGNSVASVLNTEKATGTVTASFTADTAKPKVTAATATANTVLTATGITTTGDSATIDLKAISTNKVTGASVTANETATLVLQTVDGMPKTSAPIRVATTATIDIARYLGTQDSNADGISLNALKALDTNNDGNVVVTGTLTDDAGNETTVTLNLQVPTVQVPTVQDSVKNAVATVLGSNGSVVLAGNTLTATVTNTTANLASTFDIASVVSALSAQGITLSSTDTVQIGSNTPVAVGNVVGQAATLQSQIATLAGKQSYSAVTLGDLKGKSITLVVKGQTFNFTVAQ